MKASRNVPARRSSSSNRSRSSSRRWLGDVLAGSDHRIGSPAALRKTRPTPWVQRTEPSGRSSPERGAELRPVGEGIVVPM